MKKNKPDLSNHKASLGLLATIFPQLGPVARIFDDSHVVYTRASAPFGIAIQLVRTMGAAFFFLVMVALVSKFEQYLPGSGKKVVTRLSGVLFGLPAMMVILLSLNRSFDLFYLWITGSDFDKADSGLGAVKIFLLVFGFVGSLFAAGYGYFKFDMYAGEKSKMLELRQAQQEFFTHLDQGRAAWNKYITEGAMHNIDFSGADLSKRNFKGFFFYSVDFIGTNLSDTVFDDCYLGYARFDDAVCNRTTFKESYLQGADFKNTDLTAADLSGAYGEKYDFKKAKVSEDELKKLQKPDKSHWHGVSWFDFRTEEWLREKGYWSDGRKPKGLPF